MFQPRADWLSIVAVTVRMLLALEVCVCHAEENTVLIVYFALKCSKISTVCPAGLWQQMHLLPRLHLQRGWPLSLWASPQ